MNAYAAISTSPGDLWADDEIDFTRTMVDPEVEWTENPVVGVLLDSSGAVIREIRQRPPMGFHK